MQVCKTRIRNRLSDKVLTKAARLALKTTRIRLQNGPFGSAKRPVLQLHTAHTAQRGAKCKHLLPPQLRLTCRPVLLSDISTKRALGLVRLASSTFLMRAAASGSFAIMYR